MNQLVGNNPQYQKIVEGMKGKTNDEMKQYVENLANERGINLEQFMAQMGFQNKQR